MADLNLHPECKGMLEYLQQTQTDNSKLTLAEIRKNHFERFKVFSGGYDLPFDGDRTELFIPSPHVKDGIPVFVYTPSSVKKDPAIFVYFHGGGQVLGTRYGHDSSCKVIACSAGCIIVNVEYRLAPEHKFPAMMEDAECAVTWVKQNKAKLGGTAQSKVGVGGDSAGGTITASVVHDVAVDFQVLVYPHTTTCRDYSLDSMVKYVDGPLLSVPYIKWFEDHTVPIGEETNPRIASILRAQFDHLPPALFIIAEYDPLHTGSWMYANKLKENGVPVEVHEFKGAIHAFYGCTAFCPQLCAEAYKYVSDFIQKFQT